MFVIRMDNNKNLYAVSPTSIYAGENNADSWRFLLPVVYEGTELEQCTVLLQYVDQRGSHSSVELAVDTSVDYEHALAYTLPISDMFTATINKYAFWIEAKRADGSFVLKSGPLFVPILPSEPLMPVTPDKLPELVEMWQRTMEELYQESLSLRELCKNKADGLMTHDDGSIQLTAEGCPIGTTVLIKDICEPTWMTF